MSTIKTKKVQVGTDSTASNNFTIYTPGTPDGTVRIGNGNADSVTDAITLDSSGNITAAQNLTVSGDLSVTGSVPANTGPAFSAYASGGNTTVTNRTYTVVAMNNEDYDTDNCYDTSTYRFTPNVAGYYSVTITTNTEVSGLLRSFNELHKNGSRVARGTDMNGSAVAYGVSSTYLVYMNGTTDYLQPVVWIDNSSTPQYRALQQFTWWNGHLVRAA